MRTSSLFALLLLAAGCADRSEEPSAPAPVERDVALDEEAVPEEVRPGIPLDRILAERADDGPFLRTLRPPRSTRVEPVANEYVAGQVDTLRTRVYDGVTIQAYEVSGGKTFLRQIDVTGGDYGTRDGLALGATRDEIEALLGAPERADGPSATYSTGSAETPMTIVVDYEPDPDGTERSATIRWIPYLD